MSNLIDKIVDKSGFVMIISGACTALFILLYYVRVILLAGIGLSLIVLGVSIYAKFFMKKHLKKLERDFK